MKKIIKLIGIIAFSAMVVSSSLMADTVKFGVQAPITGPYANEGQAIDNFVRLIVKEKNEQGGLLGKKIEVVTCDDEGKAQKAVICAQRLSNAGVIAAIGSYSSTATAAPQATYYRNKVLQTSNGTKNSLTDHKYWTFFRNAFPNSAEGEFIADYLVNKRNFKRIVVLSDYSSYSDGLANVTVATVKKLGGNVIYRGKYKANSQNFTAILTKVKSMNPDVIFSSGYYSDGGLMKAQQKELGIDAEFVGGDAQNNTLFSKLAGNAAEGTKLINMPMPDDLPYLMAKKYLKSYVNTYGIKPPSIWSLTNADGLRAIMYAIEKTKSFDTKKISTYLHTLNEGLQGITGPISFNKDGERVNIAFGVYEIQKDGSFKLLK